MKGKTEKTIEDANKSLLKKQEANQGEKKDVLPLLQSKIKEGKIKEARRMALKHLYDTTYREAIIELFRTYEIPTFQCTLCKKETERKFNVTFLVYDRHQQACSDCEVKIENAATVQRHLHEITAFKLFEEQYEDIMDNMLQRSGVPYIFRPASKDDLDKAIAAALQIDQSYFITGEVGVGKSHMAAVLIRAYLETLSPEYDQAVGEYSIKLSEEDMPVFIEVPELLLRIRATYHSNSSVTEMDIVDDYTRTPYLVLDDLGAEKSSDFSTLMLYLIINRRFTSGKVTIITSNLTLPMIQANLSERISSRIKGMCREITVAGSDKRYESEQKQGNSQS